jgi:hypothetical protein
MDFNINNYSLQELKELFDITELYDMNIITQKIQYYIQDIYETYNELDKEKMMDFLNNAYERIIEHIHPSNNENSETKLLINHDKHSNDKIDTFKYKFKKGKINPLRKQTRILNLNINSLFRKNYQATFSTDFIYSLPMSIKNVVSMQVSNIELPNNIFVFSQKNNSNEFNIITYDVSGTQILNQETHNITIEEGNYDVNTFVSYLNEQVFAKRPNLKRVAVVYNSIKKSIQFIRNTNGTTGQPDTPTLTRKFDIDFRISSDTSRPIQLNMGWLMGYRKPYYNFDNDYIQESEINPVQSYGFQAESYLNLIGSKYFLLHINDYNNNTSPVYETPFQEGLIISNYIMDKIQNNGNSIILENNYNNCNDKKRKYYGPVNIDKLEIKLYDDVGRIVDIHNADFSFTLQLEIMYDL